MADLEKETSRSFFDNINYKVVDDLLAIFHTKLLTGDWGSELDPGPEIILSGLDLDPVWEEIVKMVGTIEVEEGNTLEEQIHYDEARAKLLKRIEDLEAKSRSEKQSRRRLEMFEELQELKKQLHKQ